MSVDVGDDFLKNRVVFMEKEFNEEHCSLLTKQLLHLYSQDTTKDIIIYIDSFGGSVLSFLQVYNVIKTFKCKVHTIVMGKAMSAGALLLISGTKGYRFAYKHSQIMLHELSSGAPPSKLHDLQTDFKYTIHLQNILNDIIIENTKISKKDVTNLLKDDIYLTAEKAKKLGIIDNIIE